MSDFARDRSAVAEEIAALAAVAEVGDLATPVPTCPGWDVQAVVKHVGVVHRWATQMIRDGMVTRLDFRDVEDRQPADGATWGAWLRAGGDRLATQLEEHAADAPVWTWGPGGTVGWWARRLVHETFVHRADTVLALGGTPEYPTELAVDGIDEFLANLASAATFAPAVADVRGAGETLHVHATDAAGEWMVTLTPEGFAWDHGHGKGDVAVRGPVVGLLLLVYGRLPADDTRFERFGDAALLDRWLAQTAV